MKIVIAFAVLAIAAYLWRARTIAGLSSRIHAVAALAAGAVYLMNAVPGVAHALESA